MTAAALPYNSGGIAQHDSARRARTENFVAFAFALFAAAILSLALLPPPPASDPSEIDALEIVAGP